MLQAPRKVRIGDREYEVAPPSFGTLMLVSEILARVPDMGDLAEESANTKAALVLQRAREFGLLPELLATLILGSKHVKDTETYTERRKRGGIRGLFGAREETVKTVSVYERMVAEIRDNVEPAELSELVPWLIGGLQLTDFFVLTTFLREIKLAEPTKVEKKATARGRSSQASSNPST